MTTVMTSGVFDLLHVGHLRMLNWAAQHGDRLLVMVDHDTLVQKGPDRPIRPILDRLELLCNLRCVSGAVAATDFQAQCDVIRAWKPTVFVKGADWDGKPLPFQAALDEVGCAVRYAPYHAGYSTSGEIKRLRDAGWKWAGASA